MRDLAPQNLLAVACQAGVDFDGWHGILEHMFGRLGSLEELGLPPTRSCSDQELIDALGEAARREAMCAERKLAYANELHRRRVRQDEADGVSCAYRGRGTVAEIAAALTVGRGTAAVLLHLGCELGGRLPATGAALAAGDIDLSRARIISDATLTLHDEHAALVEYRVLPRLIGRNADQLHTDMGGESSGDSA